jgi:hypothetical protein
MRFSLAAKNLCSILHRTPLRLILNGGEGGNGNGSIHRNHGRSADAGLYVDTVIPFLAIKSKSFMFEYADEILKRDRTDGSHAYYLMLIVRRSIDTNSGARHLPASFW